MTTDSPRKLAPPVPATKRMAALRERRRAAGMKPIEIWAHPDDHQAIRELAARLAKARDAAANATAKGPARSDGPA
jgi:hypothetical protein